MEVGFLVKLVRDVSDYTSKMLRINQKENKELKLCFSNRMKQFTGTCWFNCILNIIIGTQKLKENMYK
jgi:ubiquitin C-terminal hydrolase